MAEATSLALPDVSATFVVVVPTVTLMPLVGSATTLPLLSVATVLT